MMVKDHYKTLGIPVHATQKEIKQAYRKLVMQYHPDKSREKGAAAVFSDIKEAYETLVNPRKKEDYLQKRWYYRSLGKKINHPGIETPYTILQESIDLNRRISSMGAFRVNKEALHRIIHDFLTDEKINILNDYNDEEINRQIIYLLLQSTNEVTIPQLRSIGDRLQQVSSAAEYTVTRLPFLIQQKKINSRREKLTPLIIAVVTLLICLLIYLLSR